jgi:hypothetical protein
MPGLDDLADAADAISVSSGNQDDMVSVQQNERRRRFIAGKAFIVLANKEAYESKRRERDPNYKAQMKANWQAKKSQYNEARRKRREEAYEELRKAGFYVKSGRPAIPPGATLIPKAAIEPVSIDELVLLGDPMAFDKVEYQIKIPDDYARVAAYLGVSVINVDVSPLKWGVWRFSAWDELQKTTRSGYIGNARNSLGGDVGYLADPKNKGFYEQYLLYDKVKDRFYTDLERDLVEVEDEEIENIEELAMEKRKGKTPFSRNPIRIVDFMLAIENFDPWFVVQQTCDQAYTVANARASALASVCYAYCRKLFKDGNYKGELFAKVLKWSFIFERYTRVAKRITGDKHASQQTSKEKAANTVEWSQWRAKSRKFIERYFVLQPNNTVRIRTRADGWVPWWPEHPKEMRSRVVVLDNEETEKKIVPKTLLPWWKESYLESEKARDRPNLRELRDAAMVACYSLLAPIRLDWSTVEIKTEKEFAQFQTEKQEADESKVQDEGANPLVEVADDVKKKRRQEKKKFNINIIVVNSKDPKVPITSASMAYFGKMKNIKSFRITPVPKFIKKESALCENILIEYLNERRRLGFKSDCLFPYSTYMDIDLKPKPTDVKTMYCFNNSAFGERLADLSYDITGKNFTETLMRRSYITWFWKQPGNSPLNEAKWSELLPSVHQNSKSANLGYLKGYNEEFEAWSSAKPRTNDEVNEFRNALERRALQAEGQDVEAGQNPENDNDDVKEMTFVSELIQQNRKEEKFKVQELRRSKRLSQLEPAPFVAKANPVDEAGELAKDALVAANKAVDAVEVLKAKKVKVPKAKAPVAPQVPAKAAVPKPALKEMPKPELPKVQDLPRRGGLRPKAERQRYF